MSQVKTAISINNSLLEETDHIASELAIPRSQVVSLALQDFVQRYQNKKLLAQINDAYSTPPSQDEIENIEIMRSHQKKHQKGEEWK